MKYVTDAHGRPVFAYKRSAASPRKTAQPNDPEAQLQRAVVEYLTFALPMNVLWTSTLNGAHLSQSQRVKMKAQGMRPGVPDLLLCKPNGAVKAIELKADKGRLSPEQEKWQAAMGIAHAVCRSVDEVERALIRFGIQPRCSVAQASRYYVGTADQPTDDDLDVSGGFR